MRVFGIDPGSVVTGYGVVELRRGRLHLIDAGYIRTSSKSPMSRRLTDIYQGLYAAIEVNKPDAVAIEEIFRHKSSESALRLGQARGVALLAAGQHGFDPVGYNASTVKRTVGGHGKADKKALAKIVQMLIGQTVEGPLDMCDAIAIAITHCNHARSRGRLVG